MLYGFSIVVHTMISSDDSDRYIVLSFSLLSTFNAEIEMIMLLGL